MTKEVKKEKDIMEILKTQIENSNIKYFKDKKECITPSNIHHLLDMCVFYNNEEIFDYLLTFEFADVAYDDSILFNYSVEIGNSNFIKKLAKYPEIDICNDDCWILKYVFQDKIEEMDTLLSFKKILNHATDEWIKENIHSYYDNFDLFMKKISIYRKKNDIENF